MLVHGLELLTLKRERSPEDEVDEVNVGSFEGITEHFGNPCGDGLTHMSKKGSGSSSEAWPNRDFKNYYNIN